MEIVVLVSNDWMQNIIVFQNLQNCTDLKFILSYSFPKEGRFQLLQDI